MAEKTLHEIIEENYKMFEKELPAPSHKFGHYKDVQVGMQDGVKLMTRVFFPEGNGPWPVILVRNPYSPVNSLMHMNLPFLIFVKYGYVVVYQQVRGQFDSEGEWLPFENERKDGIDTVRWITEQSWMNGNIGTYGGSYLGHVQWCIADLVPPKVKTMYFSIYGGEPYELFYMNGMFKQGIWTLWAMGMINPDRNQDLSQMDKSLEKFSKALQIRPHIEMDRQLYGKECSWYRNWITNPGPGSDCWNSGFWAEYKEVARKVKIPVMFQSGWFDIFLESAIKTFRKLPANIRKQSRFVIGPWHHGNFTGGDLNYPNDNTLGTLLIKDALEWFDHHLKSLPYNHPKGVVETYVIGEGI